MIATKLSSVIIPQLHTDKIENVAQGLQASLKTDVYVLLFFLLVSNPLPTFWTCFAIAILGTSQ